jgi:hypothetical protein
LAEYFEIWLFSRVCFGSAGIFGWAVDWPEAIVRRPALRTIFLDESTTRSTDESNALNLFFSLGNSIAPPLAAGSGGRAADSALKPGQDNCEKASVENRIIVRLPMRSRSLLSPWDTPVWLVTTIPSHDQ